jgi:hypothetical protein
VPKVKNVTAHVDCLHDGRPLPAYGVADVTQAELEEPHYRVRIADGLLLVVSGEEAVEPPAAEPDKPKSRRRGATKEEK